MKNWDANDATQLWVIVICRMYEKGMVEIDKDLKQAIKDGLLWCIRNMRDHHGFTGYKYNPHRAWNGCMNQSWKDSLNAYILEDGNHAKHPIKDVFGSALTWSALKYGEKLFTSSEPYFAAQLQEERQNLKKRFNSVLGGFLMQDKKSKYYYADALDANNQQIVGISCDPGLALWAYCDGESVIDDKYIPHVVDRLMMNDMFDKDGGIRTYSCEGSVYDPIGYHRGQNNFWPFVSALIADGFNHLGYTNQAEQILRAMVHGIKQFNSCVELFVKKDGRLERFVNPFEKQVSCTDQAWTAGALYYAANFLKRRSIVE
jgi:glycogen debranching enzyme